MPTAGDRTALTRDVPVRTASPGMMAPDTTEQRRLAVCRPGGHRTGERRKAAAGPAGSFKRCDLDRGGAGPVRPTRRRSDDGIVICRAHRLRRYRRRTGGLGRIVKIERRAIEARYVSTAAPQNEASICEGNGSGGLEAQSSAPANAKTTHHGTHLYSHHPLTLNRLTAGKCSVRIDPDAPSCVSSNMPLAAPRQRFEGSEKIRPRRPGSVAQSYCIR